MSGDAGGWLWFVIDVAFVALLAAVMIYAIMTWRRRRTDAAAEGRRDAATRRVYDAADRDTS
jgi:hypothetical protein